MAVQLKGTNGLCGAVGEVVDGAGEDFLAGAALAGDQHVDVRASDLAGGVHQLAHLPGDHRPAIVRQFFDRPQCRALFTLRAGLLHFVQGRED